jgi:hypothetical protein
MENKCVALCLDKRLAEHIAKLLNRHPLPDKHPLPETPAKEPRFKTMKELYAHVEKRPPMRVDEHEMVEEWERETRAFEKAQKAKK